MKNETYFSQINFVQAVANISGGKQKVLTIPVSGSGPERFMYGIAEQNNQSSRLVSLAPFGLYASPGWVDELETETVRRICMQIMDSGTTAFNWTVRDDHQPLAECLIRLGFSHHQVSTHVLDLTPEYEHVFASFTATIRNQIRSSMRKGVKIERIFDEERIKAYHAIYMKLVAEQKRYWVYPVELFLELAKEINSTFFLMACVDDKIIGGGIFFYDGCSICYWHGAADRSYSHHYPTCLLIDHAIRQGYEAGKTFFGFGGSAGKTSLEQFKSYWGAERKLYWGFHWHKPTNPIWAFASSFKGKLIRLTRKMTD